MTVSPRGAALTWRAGLIAFALIAIGLPFPYFVGFANGSYVLAIGLVTAIALLCSLAQEGQERRVFLGLFGVALGVRYFAHFAIYAWSAADGGPFLNPDSSTYLHRSLFLAADNFQHPMSPALFFGTYDCAHYYLFAAAIKYLGADLYSLQVFNSALTALPGPLVFGALCVVLPRYALPVGLAVALSPTLVAFGVNDLLKDPSVVAASMVALWAIARLARAASVTGMASLMLAGMAALTFVRMSRFYVMPFLVLALVASVALAWLLRRRPAAVAAAPMPAARAGVPARRLAVMVLAILLVAELLPFRLGWPVSGMMVLDQVLVTFDTPAMRHYAAGLLDRDRPAGESEAAIAAVFAKPPRAAGEIMREFSSGRRLVSALEQEQARQARLDAVREMMERNAPEEPLPEPPPIGLKGRLARMGANGVRKLFGPFPWIGPPSWHAETVMSGDYLLFPGMPLWYAVLPFGVLGWALVAGDVLRRRAVMLPLLFVTGVVTIFSAQYLVLNLSWRQRDFLFPFLAVLACFAVDRTWHQPAARWGYRIYWVLLLLFAIVHLSVRAYYMAG